MENELEKEPTYVLFGNEAIRIYKMSLKLLISSAHITYKVGIYSDVSKFVKDAQKWDDFVEISEDDYLKLNESYLKSINNEKSKRSKNKKSIISRIFKN
jgi:hypothetical protein